MDWLKLYHEARTDPKLLTLTPEQHLVWFNLLCFASEQKIRGTIESDNFRILALEVSRGDLDLLEETLVTLEALSIVTRVTARHQTSPSVTGVKITFKNFAERQLSDGAKRQRKYKEKKKLQKQRVTGDGAVTRGDAGDVDKELELEKEIYISPAGACTRDTIVRDNPPQPTSTPRRTPEDTAAVEAARLILAGGLDTEPIARELDRLEDQPGYVTTPGWKFHVAAERQVLLSDPGKRRSPRYFFAVARGIGDDEKPRPAPPKKAPEEVAEDWTRRMREEREKEKPKVDPEYAKQLAQYNEIMRRHHERGRKL